MIKRAILALAFVPALAGANVSTNADYVAGEKSPALITPELRAVASGLFGARAEEILHAVELNMTKYDLDMARPEGRKAWHGKLHHEEVHTNDLYKIEVYTNELTGATWRYRLPFTPKPLTPVAPRTKTVMTNGIPAKLAAARLRRQIESATVSNVTVNVEANR